MFLINKLLGTGHDNRMDIIYYIYIDLGRLLQKLKKYK